MAALKENAIAMLASVSGVGLQNGDGKTDLYTGPTGKKYVITHCVVRNPTASLALYADCRGDQAYRF